MNIIWNKYTRRPLLKLLQFLPVKKNRVLCFSWGGQQYSDNPKAITNELLKSRDKYNWEIVYAFIDPDKFSHELPDGIEGVTLGSLRYFYLLATCRFVISNIRLNSLIWPFEKRDKQLYIQTMHGGHGLKKVELDVEESLTNVYVNSIYKDAKRTNLMLSDSSFWTELARTAFAYPKGEILEVGLPRNDIFFIPDCEKVKLRKKVFSDIGLKNETSHHVKAIIYCPTFRNNERKDVYGFDVDKVLSAFENRFGGEWYVLVSSHPNMRSYYKELYDFNNPRMIDVGDYPDLQQLLVVSDVAITDYSSAGFEFALGNKPVFLLAKDKDDYDRGFYFKLDELPFSFAENDDELCRNVKEFDEMNYKNKLHVFNKNIIGLKETGSAASYVTEWIVQHK